VTALHSLASLGGTDFDHVTRSETRVTRRIGGGRMEVWHDGAWHPFQPPQQPPRRSRSEVVAEKRETPERCPREHQPNWYINPNTGYRNCRTCKRLTDNSAGTRIRKAAERQERRAMRGLAGLTASGQT
jgi:hypothetical protein